MSSNLIFRVPGRTQNYMPLDVNTPKGDIMEKYARSSFSTTNQWPAESPYAGYYDIKNSDTKLILLNNQQKTSHLRGKAQSNKQTISKKDQYYEYVEKEYEKKKNSSAENSLCWGSSTSRPKMDPDRHYNSGQHSYRYLQEDLNGPSAEYKYLRQKTKSAVPFPKAQSTKSFKTTLDKKEEEQLENDILLKYLYAVGKRTTGLQNTNLNRRPPREFLSSYNLNHPEFNKGQRLFLNELCSMYSVEPLKQLKQDQYLNLFKKQTVGGIKIRQLDYQ